MSSEWLNCHPAAQETPAFDRNPEVYYCAYNTTTVTHVMNQTNSVHTLTYHSLKIYFIIILPSRPRPSPVVKLLEREAKQRPKNNTERKAAWNCVPKRLHCVTSGHKHRLILYEMRLSRRWRITISRIYPEDGGNAFLLNNSNVPDYTVSNPRQEVLGRNNRLLSFDKTWTAQKATPKRILPWRGNVFLYKLLPSKDKGDT
jgi:hypothetical protein